MERFSDLPNRRGRQNSVTAARDFKMSAMSIDLSTNTEVRTTASKLLFPMASPFSPHRSDKRARPCRYMPFSNVAASPMPHRLPSEITCPPLYDTCFGREPTTTPFFSVVSVALRSFLRSFRSRLKRQLARTQPPDIPFANATVRARTWRPGCRRVPGSGRATRPDR